MQLIWVAHTLYHTASSPAHYITLHHITSHQTTHYITSHPSTPHHKQQPITPHHSQQPITPQHSTTDTTASSTAGGTCNRRALRRELCAKSLNPLLSSGRHVESVLTKVSCIVYTGRHGTIMQSSKVNSASSERIDAAEHTQIGICANCPAASKGRQPAGAPTHSTQGRHRWGTHIARSSSPGANSPL